MFKPIESKMDFPLMEKKWLRYWYEKGIVNKYLKKNLRSKKYFSFLDGPITANNPMGVHHAWGRTYKDLWPRFYNLLGYRQRFQNGFDCQGLWVEVEVEKELGLKSKKEIENLVPGDKKASIARFVDLCKKRVYKFAKIQTEQSKRLGYFADWEHSYYTMSDENNYMIWHFLKKCYENGWIYKGRDSVPWCPRCETAISEHEILTEDYKELTHDSIILEFPLEERKNEFLLVWTTTPWTIPANIAVAVDEEIEYSLVREGKNSNNQFWVAKALVEKIFQGKHGGIIKTVKGRELAGLHYRTAFDHLEAVKKAKKKNPEKFHSVIATDPLILPVSLEEGTGLVHTAVSAGTEDFRLGKKLGLPMIPVIGDNADYLPGLGEFSGKNAKKNPRLILDYLEKREKKEGCWVFSIFPYTHRYPVCWRCKTELVWKVADEWYIAMDRRPSPTQNSKLKTQNLDKKTLRERMIEVARSIRWLPAFGLERELDWLKNMSDWLISKKNRYWGLALPIYECQNCGWFTVIGSKEELKQKAVKGWEKFKGHSPHKPFVDEVMIQCLKCQSLVRRIEDVGNPWLDAGIVPYSTISENNQGEPLYKKDKKQWRRWFPADFITESFPGQFKNWFYALIAESTVLENTKPFKTVLGFGTLLGEDGRPMHKSWGNAIEFNDGADKIGVDVMRWMYCRQNPSENLLFGYKKADEVRRQFYLMLWNVYKFFVDYSNLDKINLKSQIANLKSASPISKLNILDQWILARFAYLVEFVEKKLKEFNAKDAALEIESFVNDFSLWYIRRSRERVWVNSDDQKDKNQFYQTTYFILVNLSIILSPFLPFITEEIYTNLTGKPSVHLEDWPRLNSLSVIRNLRLIKDMELVRRLVEVGHRVRKELKIKVRQPLASAEFSLSNNYQFFQKQHQSEYQKLIGDELNVKKIIIDYKKTLNQDEIKLKFETKLTTALIKEGKFRELIRKIQNERKTMGIRPDQRIKLTIPKSMGEFTPFLRKKVLAKKIELGDYLKVEI